MNWGPRRGAFAVACALALATASARAQEDEGDPGPGRWRLSTDGERYSLWANDVPIQDVLDGLQRMASGPIEIKSAKQARVSARYFNVSLEDLLSRMGLEFFLLFGRDRNDGYALETGWVGYDPERKAPVVSPFPTLFHATASARASNALSPAACRKLCGNGTCTPDPADVGVTYRAAFPVHVALDGDTRDWPGGTPWQRVTHDLGPSPATNDADASFEVAGVSDGTNVYLAVQIADDLKAVTNAVHLPLARDDAVQLFLQGVDGAPVNFMVNRHHVLMAGSDGLQLPARQYVSQSSGTYAVISDGDKGWALELAVPLSLLGTDLSSKREVSFNLVLYDRDAGKDTENTLVWSRSAQLGDLSRSGRLQFVDIR